MPLRKDTEVTTDWRKWPRKYSYYNKATTRRARRIMRHVLMPKHAGPGGTHHQPPPILALLKCNHLAQTHTPTNTRTSRPVWKSTSKAPFISHLLKLPVPATRSHMSRPPHRRRRQHEMQTESDTRMEEETDSKEEEEGE